MERKSLAEVFKFSEPIQQGLKHYISDGDDAIDTYL